MMTDIGRDPLGQALAVPVEPQERLAPTGFDPSRNHPADYTAGWNDAIQHCVAIAERWRDENKAERARALKSGRRRFDLLGDETMFVMAEQLDGAAIECNAMAAEMRGLAIAMEARQGPDRATGLEAKPASAVGATSAETPNPSHRSTGE